MAENADTIADFDKEIRLVTQEAIDSGLSRTTIAGVLIALAADFNGSRPLLAAYPKVAETKPTA